MPHGSLEVIVGCMSSGKSEELLRRLRRAQIAKQGVAVFKPQVDTRTANSIASRNGVEWQAFVVKTADEIPDLVSSDIAVVGLDEAQFFDVGILAVADALVARGLRVIASGLDLDYNGKPFEPVPQLMAMADEVLKLSAVCMRCAGTATRTYLRSRPTDLPSDERRIIVGGDGMYEARCRECWGMGE